MRKEKEQAVLQRLVYLAHQVLHKRFPSARMTFRKNGRGQLEVDVSVLGEEDTHLNENSPGVGLAQSFDSLFGFIGVGTSPLPHDRSIWTNVRHRSFNRLADSPLQRHSRMIHAVSGGVDTIIGSLDKLLPEIPFGQGRPRVIFE